MSNILEAVKQPVIQAWNFVSTNTVSLGNKAYNLCGRIVSAVTPVLSSLVAKIQSLNPQSYFQKAWSVAKANPAPAALLLTGAVTTIALSLTVKSTAAKYALRIAGIAILVLSAVAATSPFGNKTVKA